MPTQMTIFIGAQCVSLLVFCVVGLMAAQNRQRMLQRIIATPQGEARSFATYLQYTAERVRLLLSLRRTNTYTLLILFCVSAGFIITQFSVSTSDTLFFLSSLFPILLAIGVGMFVGATVHDTVGGITSDAEALSLFRINNLRSHDILVQKLRRILISTLPTALYLEALGIVMVAGNMGYAPYFLLLGLAVLGLALRTAFGPALLAWMISARPIEQTEWAYLVPRIAAWAQAARITFASIVVQQDLVGEANVRIVGLGRPMLILSESFLRSAEWRQQDAAVAIAIGIARKHILRSRSIYSGLLIAISALFLSALLVTTSVANSLSTDTYAIFLFLLAFYFLLRVIQRYALRFLRAKYFDVDRIAAQLTGDPVGVMVALHTFNVLNGVPATLRSTKVPSVNERISVLDRLVRTPWPRAPYAAEPVPSIAPVTIGQYMLTVPFNRSTDASRVPEAPYVQLM